MSKSHAAATTPFIALTPTRTRINPAKYEGDSALYVTQNEAGSLRAAEGFVLDLHVGDTIEAKHATRGTSYGLLTIVAVVTNGNVEGDAPDANVPFRLVG